MNQFTETIRKAYEHYLLGEKVEAFSLLIPGTKHHYYLSIIDAMKRERHKLSKDTLEMIEYFKSNFPRDEDVVKVHLQQLFLKYDGATSDDERAAIIDELDKNYVYGYYTHNKPADVKRKKDPKAKEGSKDASTFDQSKFFDEEKVIKDAEKKPGLI
jgi:hypothetical protein